MIRMNINYLKAAKMVRIFEHISQGFEKSADKNVIFFML